jgi:DNA polymerase III sliding clamp (beta) subunit (PCNA family)
MAVSSQSELTGVQGAVDAKTFLALLKQLKTKEIDIEQKTGCLLIRSGKTKEASMAFSDIALPLEELSLKKGEWVEVPQDFVTALKHCRHLVSKDTNKPIIMCVHVMGGWMYGSDGRKLTRYDLGEEAELFHELTFPGDCANAIIKHNPTQCMVDDTWIYFGNDDDTVLSVRSMDGLYPFEKCDKVIDEFDGHVIDFPVDLGTVLKRADIFSRDDMSGRVAVVVNLTEGTTIITSKNFVGMYREECKNDYQGPELLFSFPPGMLLDMADDVKTVKVNKNAILFEADLYTHVIALIRG